LEEPFKHEQVTYLVILENSFTERRSAMRIWRLLIALALIYVVGCASFESNKNPTRALKTMTEVTAATADSQMREIP